MNSYKKGFVRACLSRNVNPYVLIKESSHYLEKKAQGLLQQYNPELYAYSQTSPTKAVKQNAKTRDARVLEAKRNGAHFDRFGRTISPEEVETMPKSRLATKSVYEASPEYQAKWALGHGTTAENKEALQQRMEPERQAQLKRNAQIAAARQAQAAARRAPVAQTTSTPAPTSASTPAPTPAPTPTTAPQAQNVGSAAWEKDTPANKKVETQQGDDPFAPHPQAQTPQVPSQQATPAAPQASQKKYIDRDYIRAWKKSHGFTGKFNDPANASYMRALQSDWRTFKNMPAATEEQIDEIRNANGPVARTRPIEMMNIPKPGSLVPAQQPAQQSRAVPPVNSTPTAPRLVQPKKTQSGYPASYRHRTAGLH